MRRPSSLSPKPAAVSPSWLAFSEETRELINRSVEYGKRAVYYGWIPFILFIGFWRSEPRPSIFRMLNPLS